MNTRIWSSIIGNKEEEQRQQQYKRYLISLLFHGTAKLI